MTGLDAFTPLSRTVTVRGRAVAVTPLTLGRLVAAAEAARPIGAWMTIADYRTILDEHPEAARAVIVRAIGLSEAEADELDMAETVELLAAHYEVNADFFMRRLGPAMRSAREAAAAILERAAPKTAPTGEKPSPGSASEDIPSPTASA